jgi:hypothetical protein
MFSDEDQRTQNRLWLAKFIIAKAIRTVDMVRHYFACHRRRTILNNADETGRQDLLVFLDATLTWMFWQRMARNVFVEKRQMRRSTDALHSMRSGAGSASSCIVQVLPPLEKTSNVRTTRRWRISPHTRLGLGSGYLHGFQPVSRLSWKRKRFRRLNGGGGSPERTALPAPIPCYQGLIQGFFMIFAENALELSANLHESR